MTPEVGLAITLEPTSAQSLRSQLAQGLRDAVAEGALQRGDTMPPSRVLAKNLGVSRGTVVAAYEQLIGEGYLEARPGSGTVVAVLPFASKSDIAATGATLDPRGLVAPSRRGHIDLLPGQPSTIGLAGPAWRSAWRRASRADPAQRDHDPVGLLELRVAIAEHVRHARGVICDPADIIVTAGTSDAMALITVALAQAGHPPRIVVENPGYPTVRDIISTLGACAIPVPLAGGSLSLDALECIDRPDAVVVTPSHHYPTGGRMSVRSRIALLDWATTANAQIIEDDYDSEFRYDLAPLPALASLDSGDRVTLVGSFSKVLTPALRCGYIVSRGDFGDSLRRVRQILDSPVSEVQQLALADYISSGALARHISRLRRGYRHRRDLLITRVSAMHNVSLSGTGGGLHAVIHMPADARQLAHSLEREGVLVSLLSEYWVDPNDTPNDAPNDAIVIGYAGPTTTELSRALDILERHCVRASGLD